MNTSEVGPVVKLRRGEVGPLEMSRLGEVGPSYILYHKPIELVTWAPSQVSFHGFYRADSRQFFILSNKFKLNILRNETIF